MQENRQRKIIDLTSYTSTEKWKLFESMTHVHINRLGTTPLLYLSFISTDFVEVLLKSGLKIWLKLFYKGNYYLVSYSCYIYNQMSTTQDIQILLMERYICPHPIHNQTLIDTSKVFWRSNTYTCISNLSERQWNHSSYVYIFQEFDSINNNFNTCF